MADDSLQPDIVQTNERHRSFSIALFAVVGILQVVLYWKYITFFGFLVLYFAAMIFTGEGEHGDFAASLGLSIREWWTIRSFLLLLCVDVVLLVRQIKTQRWQPLWWLALGIVSIGFYLALFVPLGS